MRNHVILSLVGLCAILLAVGLLLRLWPAPADAQTPAASEAGRYSLSFSAGSEYFLDTKTGRIWVNQPIFRQGKGHEDIFAGMHWVETSSPVSKEPDHP